MKLDEISVIVLSKDSMEYYDKPLYSENKINREFVEYVVTHPKKERYSLPDFERAYNEGYISDSSYIIIVIPHEEEVEDNQKKICAPLKEVFADLPNDDMGNFKPDPCKIYCSPSGEVIMAFREGKWQMYVNQEKCKNVTFEPLQS